MIQLDKFSHHGSLCPKCGNDSVFQEKMYKFLGLIYVHTIEICEMGPNYCDYTNIIIEKQSNDIIGEQIPKRSVLTEKLNNPESWEEILDEYNCLDLSEIQHGRPAVNLMDWLEEHYNTPTRK